MRKKREKFAAHNKRLTLGRLNDKIDSLIIAGKARGEEYRRLTRLHFILTHA